MWTEVTQNKLEGFLCGHATPRFESYGYLSKCQEISLKGECLNSYLRWFKEACYCLDTRDSLEKQLASHMKSQCATNLTLQSSSTKGRGWEDYARTWTGQSSSTVWTPRRRTRKQMTMSTPLWRSGLMTKPAVASGHREVCLDEKKTSKTAPSRGWTRMQTTTLAPGWRSSWNLDPWWAWLWAP